MARVFLLSPAHLGGERARLLTNPLARFPLALELRAGRATLGEVMSFVSGLYFRGKLTYARAFARPPEGVPGALAITSSRGLISVDERVSLAALGELGAVDIDPDDSRYRRPLARDARLLFAHAPECEVVLLGSVASAKYVSVLEGIFGERLLFPPSFVGRGDMSRGGLLLRCARAGEELDYAPVRGAVVHGARPPKLPKRR